MRVFLKKGTDLFLDSSLSHHGARVSADSSFDVDDKYTTSTAYAVRNYEDEDRSSWSTFYVGRAQGSVVGALKNVHFYPPMSDGEFQDFLDDLHHAGANVSDDHVHVTWNGASYVLRHDEDLMRAQLTQTGAGGDSAAWSQFERVHEKYMHVDGDDEVGADDTKTYGPYSPAQANAMLDKVKSQGMIVTGSNPWKIDTQTHGVKLAANYDGTSITIKITDSAFYVSNAKVWDKLDPLMASAKNISGDGSLPATSAAAKSLPTTKPASALDAGAAATAGSGTMALVIVGVIAALFIFGRE